MNNNNNNQPNQPHSGLRPVQVYYRVPTGLQRGPSTRSQSLYTQTRRMFIEHGFYIQAGPQNNRYLTYSETLQNLNVPLLDLTLQHPSNIIFRPFTLWNRTLAQNTPLSIRQFFFAVAQAVFELRNWRRDAPYQNRQYRRFGQDILAYQIVIYFDEHDGEGNFRRVIREISLRSFRGRDITQLYNYLLNRYNLIVLDPTAHREGYYDIVGAGQLDTGYFDIKYPMLEFDNNHQPIRQPNNNVRDVSQHKHMLFDTLSPPNNTTACIQSCIDNLPYVALKESIVLRNNITSVDFLRAEIQLLNLPIAIVYNTINSGFYTQSDLEEGENAQPVDVVGAYVRLKLKGKYGYQLMRKVGETTLDTLIFMYKPEQQNIAHYLVYDVSRNHIELATNLTNNLPKTLPSVYINNYLLIKYESPTNYTFIRDYFDNFPARPPPCAPEDTLFCFFDLECFTEYKENCASQPYAISYAIMSLADLAQLDTLDKDEQADDSTFLSTKLFHSASFDCVNLFIAKILSLSQANPSGRIVLVGFNNTNYDNFMLLHSLLITPNVVLKHISYHGSSRIADILFENCNVFDLRRHIVSSLKKACESFGVKRYAKTDLGENITHDNVQLIAAETGMDAEEAFYHQLFQKVSHSVLEKYNNYDVLSLAVLFFRYYTFMNTFPCFGRARKDGDGVLKEVYEYSSGPAFMYGVFQAYKKINNVELPSIDYSQYNFIREAMVGGRVQAIPGAYREPVRSLDVTSMYPSVMFVTPEYIPSGEITEGVMSQEFADTIMCTKQVPMGFYTVDFDQTSLAARDLPVIMCSKHDGLNDWSYSAETLIRKKAVVGYIDLQELIDSGCSVQFLVGERYITFSSKIRNIDLFGFLIDLMKAKNRQDELAAANDPDYSPVERNLAKLMQNALFGKCLQQVFESTLVTVRTSEYMSNLFCPKDMKEDTLELVSFLPFAKGNTDSMDKVLLKYMRADNSFRNIKPQWVGYWVTAMARRTMRKYLNLLGNSRVLYHDTDSVKYLLSNHHLLKPLESMLVPHWPELAEIIPEYTTEAIVCPGGKKKFGGLESDMHAETNTLLINNKKEYFTAVCNPDGTFKLDAKGRANWSMSMKGVQSGAILLDPIPSFIRENSSTQNFVVLSQLSALKHKMDMGSTQKISIPEVALRMFEMLMEGTPVYIMNCVFMRDVSEVTVRVMYVIKKITPHCDEPLDILLNISN